MPQYKVLGNIYKKKIPFKNNENFVDYEQM